MKSFEEEFPSLKFKQINISFDIERFDKRWNTEEHLTRSVYNESDIEEHCLDKQRVKETIIQGLKNTSLISKNELAGFLFKELNLED